MTPCDYYERTRRCASPGVHQVQLDGKQRRLCYRHIQPEFHPPDLHKKLPGLVKRAVGRRQAAS